MPMNNRLLRPRQTGNVAVDVAARAYIESVRVADGGRYMEVGVQRAIDAFVTGCKADGIWGAIKASCILAGARTLAGALVPLVGAAPTNFNFVSGDYNRKTGLVGDGTTKYLDSNRAGNADPKGSHHFGMYVSAAATGSVANYIGTNSTFPNDTSSIARSSANLNFNSRSITAVTSSGSGTATEFIGASRANTSFLNTRVNQSSTSTSNAAANDSAINWYVYAVNGNGSTVNDSPFNLSNGRLAFYSIGESLDLALLDSRVSTLYTAIGAAIP